MKIEITNADRVGEQIEQLIRTNLKKNLEKAMLETERKAKENCHFAQPTGHLKRSITSQVFEEGKKLIGECGTNVEYAPYVEYGTGLFAAKGNGRKDVPWHYKDEKGQWHTTSGQHPQPFLTPAFNTEEIMDQLKEGLLNGGLS